MTSFLLWLLQFVQFLLVLGGLIAVAFLLYMLRELKKDKENDGKNEDV